MLALVITALAASGALHGCGGRAAGEGEAHVERAGQVLARVGDVEITVQDFDDSLAAQGAYVRPRYATKERRRAFLEDMIRFELLAQEARRRGYFERDDVQRTRRLALIQAFLARRFPRDRPVDPERVRAYYARHRSEFRVPAQVRISQILVATEAEARALLQRLAQGVGPDRSAVPARFRRLAAAHSLDEASRDRGGDVGFVVRPTEGEPWAYEVPRQVAAAGFEISEPGEVLERAIHSSRGYHVLMLRARRPAAERGFEEVERMIQSRLQREDRQRAIDRLVQALRREADVVENPAALAQLRAALSADAARSGVPDAASHRKSRRRESRGRESHPPPAGSPRALTPERRP